jgi:ubiquinone/menaquinone biosynthesis C-methylase UbiE
VTRQGAAQRPPAGLERALALLEPPRRGAAAPLADGYLDLLAPAAAAPPGRAQRLMLTGALPRVYERWWRPALGRLAKGALGSGMEAERRTARALLALEPGDRVLDIACGTGAFARDFAAAVGPYGLVVGLDASPTMLARAVRDTPYANVTYVHGDAERLPFHPAAFDAVCCFAALHLLADPWTALDEMTRVLARGGRLAVLASCRTRRAPLRWVEAGLGAGLGVHMFEGDQLTAALAERGFEEVRQQTQGLVQYVGGRRA